MNAVLKRRLIKEPVHWLSTNEYQVLTEWKYEGWEDGKGGGTFEVHLSESEVEAIEWLDAAVTALHHVSPTNQMVEHSRYYQVEAQM